MDASVIWTPERQQAVVLDLLGEKDTLAGLAHENRISIQRILDWKEAYFTGIGCSASHCGPSGETAHRARTAAPPSRRG